MSYTLKATVDVKQNRQVVRWSEWERWVERERAEGREKEEGGMEEETNNEASPRELLSTRTLTDHRRTPGSLRFLLHCNGRTKDGVSKGER